VKKLLFVFLFVSFKIFSQDPVFTQFYNVPEYINPSFTGASGGTNISVLNRTQWFGLNYGLNSQFFSIDGFSEKMNSGLGLSIMNHQESTTRYNFTQMNFNYSYQVKLNRDWGFYPSISAGFGVKDYAFDNLLLEDQILIYQGIINVNSNDPFLTNDSVSFFDMSAGFLVFNDRLWFGANLKHLTNPNISFDNEGGKVKLKSFLSVHGGYKIPLKTRYKREKFNLYFNMNYMRQANFDRLDIGSLVKYNGISLGVFGAFAPTSLDSKSHKLTSLNFVTNMDYKRFTFGYSYDYNLSSLIDTKGIFEISVSYQFDSIFGDNSSIPCGCK